MLGNDQDWSGKNEARSSHGPFRPHFHTQLDLGLLGWGGTLLGKRRKGSRVDSTISYSRKTRVPLNSVLLLERVKFGDAKTHTPTLI